VEKEEDLATKNYTSEWNYLNRPGVFGTVAGTWCVVAMIAM
jgi:hypothetical protein